MKKILSALLFAALAVSLYATVAGADNKIGLGTRADNQLWRNSLAAQVGIYSDSAAATIAAGGTNFDTTTTLTTALMSQSGTVLAGNATAFGAAKAFVTVTNAVTTGDTLYLWIDSSVDGANWTAATAAISMITNGTSKQFVAPVTLDLDAAAGATGSWGLAPYLRFRVQSDAGTTMTGAKFYFSYFSNESN